MKLSIFAMSLASLCIPTVVVAQTNTGTGIMTTTPSVTCSGGAAGGCQVDQSTQSTPSTLGIGTFNDNGALRDTTPTGVTNGSTFGTGISTPGAAGPLNNTSIGTIDSGAAGPLVPATPDESLETNRGTSTAAPAVLPPPGASRGTTSNGAAGPLVPARPTESFGSSRGGL